MKAYILSAGLGTRLHPTTQTIPKVMLQIGSKPVLWYQIKLAAFYDFDEIMINLHQNANIVTRYFGDGKNFKARISYSFEKKLLGTAGAVKAAEKFFKGETFLVMYGDTLRTTNLKKLLDFHKEKGGVCTISLYEAKEPWTQGVVEIDKNGQILALVEKPKKDEEPSNLANAGVMIFEPKIFDNIPKNKFSDFGFDIFPTLVKKEKVYGFKDNSYIQDIGTPERYRKAKIDFAKGLIKFPFKIG